MRQLAVGSFVLVILMLLTSVANAAMVPFTASAAFTLGRDDVGPDFSKILEVFVPDGWKHSKSQYMMKLASGKDRKALIGVEAGEFGKMDPRAVLLSVMDDRVVLDAAASRKKATGKITDVVKEAGGKYCTAWTVVPDKGGEKEKHFFAASAELGYYVHFIWTARSEKEAMQVINNTLLDGNNLVDN